MCNGPGLHQPKPMGDSGFAQRLHCPFQGVAVRLYPPRGVSRSCIWLYPSNSCRDSVWPSQKAEKRWPTGTAISSQINTNQCKAPSLGGNSIFVEKVIKLHILILKYFNFLSYILTRWIWVWVNSGSWWWTGRPGALWFMGSQRVRHNWATELNWAEVVFGPSRWHSGKESMC